MQLAELFTTCEQLQQAGKADEALHTYKTWLDTSTDPNRFMGWFNYGSLLQSTGNTQAAEGAYRQCLAVQPRFPQGLGFEQHKHLTQGLALQKREDEQAHPT